MLNVRPRAVTGTYFLQPGRDRKSSLPLWLAAIFMIGQCFTAPVASEEIRTPKETFRDYNLALKAGADYETQAIFFTERKLAEANASVVQYMMATRRSREDVMSIMMRVEHETAKCMELSLKSKEQSEDKVVLIYRQYDTCRDQPSGTQKIRLVQENGWKIDDITIALE